MKHNLLLERIRRAVILVVAIALALAVGYLGVAILAAHLGQTAVERLAMTGVGVGFVLCAPVLVWLTIMEITDTRS